MKRLYIDKLQPAGLYDVCEWFVSNYPEDIFIMPQHPVTKIRNLCKIVLRLRTTPIRLKTKKQ